MKSNLTLRIVTRSSGEAFLAVSGIKAAEEIAKMLRANTDVVCMYLQTTEHRLIFQYYGAFTEEEIRTGEPDTYQRMVRCTT